MESRIKQLREKRGLIQEILAVELGITQQMLSKYERDVTLIKVDILKKIAAYFNVTTDYLLGVSDVKRDLNGQMKMNEVLDEYYDLVEVYKELDPCDQEMIWSIIQSFEVRPFQFLVKPVTDKIMEKCFKSVYEDINSEDFYFRYSYQRMNHKVPIKDILYFESNKRKIFIVTEQEILELYGKLNEIEETLKTCKISFLRVHQSFLVNYKHISGQSYDSVVMDNGQKISISEDRRKIISEQYCSMENTFYVDE